MQKITFHIRVNIGDKNETIQFYFSYKDSSASEKEQTEQFDKAVKELNHIYDDYGRFATVVGVTRLFASFGFERTIK